MPDTDSGGLAGLLGWFGRPYDPQAAYEGLLSDPRTKDALQARSLAAMAQAFGAGAGSDARGSAIPFGATLGNAAAAAYTGQDALITARNVAAEQMLHAAQAEKARAEAAGLPAQFKMYDAFFKQMQADTAKTAGLSPKDIIAGQQGGGGGAANDTYWTPAGLAALRPTEGRYDQIHYPSGYTPDGVKSSASGAYGFLDGTWQEQAPKAGVDIKQYPRAYLAPPEVQDKVAALTPISHWTDVDKQGQPYNFRAQRLATNPAYVTSGAQTAAVTPTEAEIYRKAPFPTLQNAGVVPPPVMTDKLPTGTIAPNPFNTPTGDSAAPAAPPGVQALTGLLGQQAAQEASAAPRAPLVPPATPPAPITPPPQQGAAIDPATQQTLAAISAVRGGGVNAAPQINGGLLASLVPGAGVGAAGAPPAGPPQPSLARLAQATGAPPIAPAAPPLPPPQAQALTGLLAQKAAQEASAAPPVTQGGGLLPQGPVRPPAAPPAAPAPPIAPPPAGAVPPAAPGAPAMPPGGIPLPALPQFTLPPPPQMQNIPVPPMPAPTTLEGMAQAIAGISSLTGHPAPAFMQDLAKMPAQRQQELYKAYLLNETNRVNEQYKKQLEVAGAGVISQLQAQGALPSKLAEMTNEQNLRLRNSLAEKGLTYGPNGFGIDPTYLQAEAQRKQQEADIETKKQFDIKAAEGGVTQALAQRTSALDAVRSLENSTEARKLLDQGIITGKGANALLEFGKALQVIGFHENDNPIANTEAYAALRAGEVGRMIKQFGSGTGLSDADREYASKMAAGSISLNEQSIRRIIDISDRASNRIIDDYNKEATRLGSRFIPPVQKPDLSAQTTGGAQLPAGVPEGSRPTGRTYQGKPVYDVPDGKGGFTPHTVD